MTEDKAVDLIVTALRKAKDDIDADSNIKHHESASDGAALASTAFITTICDGFNLDKERVRMLMMLRFALEI